MEKESAEEQAVRAAVHAFYDALEAMLRGRGIGPMSAAWHHTPRVTASHPLGEWSVGWDEVLASWEAVAAIGAEEYGGTSIRDVAVYVYGDCAYTTCVFTASPRFGSAQVNCTNVLHKDGGAWKIVHHHADKSQKIEKSLGTIAETGKLPD
jgi:ketosteroid isomerase-like protein